MDCFPAKYSVNGEGRIAKKVMVGLYTTNSVFDNAVSIPVDMFRFPASRILVFCKAPVPGYVKTRLLSDLSPQACADLHVWLSRRILGELSAQQIAPLQLWCSPNKEHTFFGDCVESFSVTLHQQKGEDLGARMHFGFVSVLKQYRSAVLIGCDSPSLSAGDIEEAFTMLDRGKDLVLAPAEDGGYVLVGLTKSQPRLFSDMPWGNTTVMAETRLRAEKLELDFGELPVQWDVDVPEDLRRLTTWVSNEGDK